MAALTIQNKIGQSLPSDKLVGGTVTPITIQANEVFTIDDGDIGPTMQAQITNGLLQVTSTVASQDAGSGFVANVDLTAGNARKVLELQSGEEFLLEKVLVRITLSDTATVPAGISLGVVSPNYNDLVQEFTLTNVLQVGDTFLNFIAGKSKILTGPTELFVIPSSPATANALEATIWVFGSGNLI